MPLVIQNLTNDYNQQIQPITEDQIQFRLNLVFNPNHPSWYYRIIYTDLAGNVFDTGQMRLTVNFNICNNYRNRVPFGIVCDSTDGGDPYFLNDFIVIGLNPSPRIQLYTLSMDELKLINSVVNA